MAIRTTHPAFLGDDSLFGEAELSPQQKAHRFLSKYQEVVDPIRRYKRYFARASEKDLEKIFSIIKRNYAKHVVSGEWTEKKFVQVLEEIFEKKAAMTNESFVAAGKSVDTQSNRVSSGRDRRRRVR